MIDVTEKGFKTYQTYLALKAHFTQKNYSFFKYNGKVSAGISSFRTRKDRYYFAKIENKYGKKVVDFLVANIVTKGPIWIGELVDEDSHKVYMDWRKRMESLRYMFSRDMSKLRHYMDVYDYEFDDLFEMKNNDHPIVFQMLMSDEISLESFVILDQIIHFVKVFNKKMLDDPIWMMYNLKIMKYSEFVRINKSDYRKVVKDIFID